MSFPSVVVLYGFLPLLHNSNFVIFVFLFSHCLAFQDPHISLDIIAKAAFSASREGSGILGQRMNLLMMSTAQWKRARAGGIHSSSQSEATTGKAATAVTVVIAKEAGHHAFFPASVGT